MATFDRSRGWCVFFTVKDNTYRVAVDADKAKASSLFWCLQSHDWRARLEQSRQTEYDRLTTLPVWARTWGQLSGIDIHSQRAKSRNQCRSLS